MPKKERQRRPSHQLISALHGLEDGAGADHTAAEVPIPRSPKPNNRKNMPKSPKSMPKSPKFRLKVQNPLSRMQSLAPSPATEPEPTANYGTRDIAKAMRRKVVARSVAIFGNDDDEDDEAGVDETHKKEKKNKSRFKNLINTAYIKTPKEGKSGSGAAASKGPVFGVALDVAVARSRVNDKLPLTRVFQESVMYIETFALQREGIYRVPGFRAKLNELKVRYNKGEIVKLTEYDPETVGMLLKLYLRELPEPLLTRAMGAKFEGVLQIEEEGLRTHVLSAMLRELPPENYATLAWLCLHISHVCKHSGVNKMTITNLVIILSPTLLISNTLLCMLCAKPELVFPGVVIDPNRGIPTLEEVDNMQIAAAADQTATVTRNELIAGVIWAQARNDALKHVKDQIKGQIREERRFVAEYEEQLHGLEEQGGVLTTDTPTEGRSEEELRLQLSVLEKRSVQSEAEKTDLYNVVMSETMVCVDTYTEIRYRQAYQRAGYV